MSSSIDSLAKALYNALNDSDAKKPEPYDTRAVVKDIEGDTVWVSIPGGTDLTPVQRTTNAMVGDEVQVRISGGRAWLTGNSTNPPTDNTQADYATKIARSVEGAVNVVQQDITVMQTVIANKADIQQLNAVEADIVDLEAQTAKIEDLTAEQLTATVGYIEDLTAADISASDISADHATIGSLDTTYATISALTADEARITAVEADTAKIHNLTANEISAATGYVGSLTAGNVSASDIIADHATVGSLDTTYATIDSLEAEAARITDVEADTAKIHNLTANEISAATGYVGSLTAGNVSASDIIADHATIDSLDSNYAHISNGVIDNAKIGHADVNGLSANYAHITNGVIDNAKIGYADVNDLDAHYASIDLANVDNAWIENGVIKNGAIGDAQIIGVSANKLTAGTIDASNITVTNLNASNITTGTINGQRIGTGSLSLDKLAEDVYTESEIDGMLSTMQAEIDGAIETFTGTVVPTLNNAPASSWTTTADKAKHVGDVYYVVNAASQADGYCYRFAYDTQTSTYSWVLIKDSDVTAALQRLIDAEGDISDLQDFESTTSSWISNTDEELSSIKSNHTSLVTVVDKTIKESVQLWFTKANTTAPSKPTAEVTNNNSTGSNSYNKWNLAVPQYNASYPNYFYCYQWKYVDNTFGWSAVTRDIAMGESQERARTAVTNAATAQSAAETADGKAVAAQNTANANIKSTVQLWFTKANTTAPNKPTAHVTNNSATGSNSYNKWNLAVPEYNASYPNYFYCYEYQKGDNTYSWSDVVLDKATTENQANARSALTQVATKVETSTFNTLSQTVDSNTANITSLTSTVGTKADSSTVTTLSNTVNEVSQTATSNSSKISNLTTTLGTNADGTTKSNDIVHRTSAVEQDLSGFKTTVSETYQTKSAMSGYSTTSQMNTAIQQSANAITQSVSETYQTKADMDDYSTTSEMNSAINQKAGEITTSVASTYTTKTEFNNLEIGGKNLLKRTADFDSSVWRDLSPVTGTDDGITYVKVWHNSSSSWVKYTAQYVKFELNQPYTVSFIARKTNTDSVNPRLGIRNDRGAAITYFAPSSGFEIDSDTWKRYTFTAQSVHSNSGTEPFRIYAQYTDAGGNTNKGALDENSAIQVARIKLEKGNKATDWSPAPEDLEAYADAAVITAKAEIKVTTDGISTEVGKKVGNNEVISKINQSAESVTIDANRVNIAGAAIFTSGRLSETSLNNAYDAKGAANAVQTNLDSLKVGGRNLLVNSRKMQLGSASWANGVWRTAGNADMAKSRVEINDSPIGTCGALQMVGIQTTTSDTSCFGIDSMPREKDADYVFSMWARVVGGGRAQAGWALYSATVVDSNADGTWGGYATRTLDPNGEWTRIWVHAKSSASATTGNIYIGGAATDSTNKTIQMCLVKVEKGTKVTDWTQAPEDALEKAVPIYCRTNSSNAPATSVLPTGIVSNTSDIGVTAPSSNGNGWTKMHMPRVCSSNTAYKYLWTCNQLISVGGYLLGHTDIVADNGTTVIDGDNIITGTVTADKLNATNINASKTLTVGAMTDAAAKTILNSNVQIGGRNLLFKFVKPEGRTTAGGDYGVVIPATQNADTYFSLYLHKNLTANKQYVISCQVSGLLDGSYIYFPLFSQGHTAPGQLGITKNGLNYLVFTHDGTNGGATTLYGKTYYRLFMDDTNRWYASGQGAITLTDFKLEEGNKPTAWSPAPEDAYAKSVPIYCRTNSSNAPATSTLPTELIITNTSDTGVTAPSSNGNGWTLMHMPQVCSSNTAYKYLWTCNQLISVGGYLLGYTDIVADNGTTIIDGGNIITGTVSASAVNASSGTFNTANIPNLDASKINAGTLNIGRIPSGALNSELSGDIANAGKTASTYITNVDANGIQIHATNNPTSNYTQIDADGMDVIKGGSSVAAFGVETRIGQQGASRVELTSNTIVLIAENGSDALRSTTSGTEISIITPINTFNTKLAGGTSSGNVFTLDLSTVSNTAPFYVTIESRCEYTYTISTQYTVWSGNLAKICDSVQIGFTKKTKSESKSATIKMANSISAQYTYDAFITKVDKTVSVAYNASTSKLTITTPSYPTIADSQYSYGGGTNYVTNGSSYLRINVVSAYFSEYIPQTEIYGRTYLDMNTDGEVGDDIDESILASLNTLGWTTYCTQ